MRYLSTFSGIEAASVAWEPLGWEPVGFSEINPFAASVLAHRFPRVTNFGDITRYETWEIGGGAVDLLVGGSPCQSFSNAGKRAGLNDPRGQLMFSYLGVARRFRPRWVVWENVPGVLSSGGGRDFGSFVGGLAKLGYGVAYRVLDAQWCRVDGYEKAVPQRRRRVFLVGCLGDARLASKVLFESQSVRRDPPSRKEEEQGDTFFADRSLGATSQAEVTRKPIVIDQSAFNQGPNATYTPIIEESDVMATLVAVRPHGVLDARATPADSVSWWDGGDVAQTITCTSNSQRMPDSGNFHGVVGNFSKGIPSVAGTLVSRTSSGGGFGSDFETSGGLVPCGLFQTVVGTDLYNVAITGDVAATLGRAGSPTTEIGPTVMGFFSNMSEPSVMFDVSPTVKVGTSSTSGCPPAVARILRTEANASEDGTSCGTRLTPTEMTVRRLTPRECERLQGFPDDWTLVPYRNKPAADGPRYKAIGNSMAVNVMRWIGMRIQANH